jgi:GH24 family phage-related lysozyme (muramidase)
MAQTVGLVNVVVALNKAYYDDAGTRIIGDGSTADDVTPREAANLSKAGALVANSDVLMDEADFALFIKSLDVINRG